MQKNNSMSSLPFPSESAQQHSAAVRAHLQKMIRDHGGSISFHNYMNAVLYAPGLGYYTAGAQKLGEAGDFITAPEISKAFGETLARSILPMLHDLNNPHWLELGAGSGKLAESILLYLATQHSLPEHYFILEVSADLKARQQEYLQASLPQEFFERITWLDRLPENFSGVILANEVLDALPVHRFVITETGVKEVYVTQNAEGFHEILSEPGSENLKKRIEALALPAGYSSEINLQQEALLKALAKILVQGIILFVDYGFPAREYYHPDRNTGTLMCHYRHYAHHDPYLWPGLQDITAHVDFTALAKCGIEQGLSLIAYTTQEAWLLHHGILEKQADPRSLQKLISPAEMGELFKVIVFAQGATDPSAKEAALAQLAEANQTYRL